MSSQPLPLQTGLSSGLYSQFSDPFRSSDGRQTGDCRLIDLSPVVRRQLEDNLNVHNLWIQLASHRYVKLQNTDVELIRRAPSPARKVLDRMVNYGLTINHLFDIFEENNYRYLLDIIKECAPHRYAEYQRRQYYSRVNIQPQTSDLRTTVHHEAPSLQQVRFQGGAYIPPTPPPNLRMNEPQSNNDVSNVSSNTDGGDDPLSDYVNVVDVAARKYHYSEISSATRNFAERYKIGDGFFGPVYRVEYLNMRLAAKVFNEKFSLENFLAELKLHIRHENIVGLMGQCTDGPNRMLLYEFMDNGTLRSNLDGNQSMNMDTRLKVLSNAAAGLEWLHLNKPPILHRNLRSTKIMLDSRGVGKVSGFHSVKNMPQTSITRNSYTCEVTKTTGSDQMKNRGYKAPDQPGKLTVKTDIYAFGVIILETLTGRQAFDENMPRDQRELVNYIEYQCEKEKVDEYELRDKRRKWVEQTFRDLFKLACDCTEDNRNARPAINLVSLSLKKITEKAERHIGDCPSSEEESDEEEEISLPNTTSDPSLPVRPENPDYVNTENQDYPNMAGLRAQQRPPQTGQRPDIAPAILAKQYQRNHSHSPVMQHVQHAPFPYPYPGPAHIYMHYQPANQPAFLPIQPHPTSMEHAYYNMSPQESAQSLRTPVEHDDPSSIDEDRSEVQRLNSQISESESSLSLSSALNSIDPERHDSTTTEPPRASHRPEALPRLNSRQPLPQSETHDYENVGELQASEAPDPNESQEPGNESVDDEESTSEETDDEEPSSDLIDQINRLDFND